MAAALFGVWALGCGPVSRGVGQYEDGRYYAALRTFRTIESRWHNEAPQARLDYALYRGLTHLALGDHDGARYWLASAWRVNLENPGVLHGERMARWREGWAQVAGAGPSLVGPES